MNIKKIYKITLASEEGRILKNILGSISDNEYEEKYSCKEENRERFRELWDFLACNEEEQEED